MNFELTADQIQIQNQVAEFAERAVAPVAERLDREAAFPYELYRQLGELGIPALPFAEEFGGMGLGTFEMALAVEQIARRDQTLAVTMMVSVAAGLILQRFGSAEQKARYLPDIVAGRALGALAGTEPDAGSDTAGFKTRGVRRGDEWVVNGSKAYITNAGTAISSVALTLVVTSPPEAEKKEYSLLAIPRGTPGYEQGEPYRKMGWRSGDTRPLYFQDCVVPHSALMGGEGQGRLLLHRGYQQARVFLSACSLGLADGALELSVRYANERKAFGKTIGAHQLVQEMCAQMAVKVEAARLLTYRAAWMADQGSASVKDLAFAKYFACETGTEVANMAVQIHGGWGFMDDCPASRYLRDNRICTIGDGSSQIQLQLIARGLGLDVQF
jgi:alkylation response protein AidB-like acyl-CoA dehydrogenase